MSVASTIRPIDGTIALIGHHNVGKSAIFQKLTHRRVTIANYPGTTVEVARARSITDQRVEFVDTPGLITFPAHTEDERATTRALLEEPLRTILQVGDAKNLRRTLLLSLQLAEMGVPIVLALNMQDEAAARGIRTNASDLGARLGIAVVPTVAVRGEGIQDLGAALDEPRHPRLRLAYPQPIELALHRTAPLLPKAAISPRGLALLWLSGDAEAARWIRGGVEAQTWQQLEGSRHELQSRLAQPLPQEIQAARLAYLEGLVPQSSEAAETYVPGIAGLLGRAAVHPVWGVPLLAGVVAATYAFVGYFGAGTLVDLLEIELFEGLLNPWLAELVGRLSPAPLLTEFLVGPYGLWSMGMTYALALILPIVTTFFLAFGVLEDSGYLPRLAVVTNRLFSRIGLNGKAVLPMVLGLGCVTMATMTTRVLESRRDRTLATLLLALGIPCSAQLGVTMGMLAGVSLTASAIWATVVLGSMLLVGWLGARLLPGERTPLLVELPPIRRPLLSNLLVKTLTRLEWYLKEVVPLFLLGTSVLFVLDRVEILPLLIKAGEPLVAGWLGLPAEASEAILMGFLRRDFGATGLFMLESAGRLSSTQITVAMVTITLFIPCVASVLMIARERGRRTAAGMVVLILPLAFLIGGLLQRLLAWIGWGA